MNRAAVLALPLLLAACATTPRENSASGWLVGTWMMVADESAFPEGCASDQVIGYAANGTALFFDERYSWRLDEDRLTETLVEGGEPDEVGRPVATRVEPTGPDAFVKTWPDGGTATFRRCPP